MTHIIRTSDRLTFKTCRQKWDFGSKMRLNYEPAVLPKPLEFGTAVHAALEVYYDPETWEWDAEVVEGLALAKFNEVVKHQKTSYLRLRNAEDMIVEIQTDFDERVALGAAMLKQYFSWADKHDNFKPFLVEVEFEVPIPVPQDVVGTPEWKLLEMQGFELRGTDLFYLGEAVVYQGRVDLVVEDDDGNYWIDDHKTAAQLAQTQWLVMDDQIGSYCWALQKQLGLPIRGFLYTELAKKILHPPTELKNGGLSKNKQQDTSYDLYVAELRKRGLPFEPYIDMLDYLKDNPKEVVRRTVIKRTQRELEILERRLFFEAVDMVNKPSIYPNPGKMNCNGCWFFDPCLATQEGSDVQFLLDELYSQRS